MFRSTLLPILLPLVTILALLTWVGWRYFYPSRRLTPQTKPAISPEPRPRLAWPTPRLFRANLSLPAFLKPGKGLLWMTIPFLLAGLTVAIILSLPAHHNLDTFDRTGIGPEQEVGMILGEEKLVPPPPLPPSIFFGTERPNLEAADRDWSRLDPKFTQSLLKLFGKLQQRGYPMALLEGYRSPERQNMLASKGPSVTNAKAFQSRHQYGLAADIAPIRNGRLVISERDPWAAEAYRVLGEEASPLGLVWGGNWTMHDLGHVEWPTRPTPPHQTAFTRP